MYENNVLQYYPHGEGYVKRENARIFTYIYQYKDHLGNVRLSYKGTPGNLTVEEQNHYYPFGMKMGLSNVVNSTNIALKYKYNGKELQDELGLNMYDYGARNYDPALGRWMNIDPLAEVSRRWSPYTYAYDNPIRFIDPDGMKADDVIQEKAPVDYEAMTRDKQESAKISKQANEDFLNYIEGNDGGGDQESDPGRRRDRQRTRNRSRIGSGSFTFDARGQELFSHWLAGSGKDLSFKGGKWGEYMADNDIINEFLTSAAAERAVNMYDHGDTSSYDITGNFPMEIENGYFTGYQMLHGTKYFSYAYKATYDKESESYIFNFNVKWVDRINANVNQGDTPMANAAGFFYTPKDYNISISWTKTITIPVSSLND